MYQPGNVSPVELVQRLVGRNALLVPIPTRSKQAVRPWKGLTLKAMRSEKHIAALNSGNLAVVTGEKSGGLCSIDIDHDHDVEPFLALNPRLSRTLTTKGRKGVNLWVRISGWYPKLTPIKYVKPDTPDDDQWGEWRATGSYTMIFGIHPLGMAYRFIVEAEPITIKYWEIAWPDNVRRPRGEPIENGCTHDTQEAGVCTQETQETYETQGTQETNDTHEIGNTGLYRTLEDVLKVAVPKATGTSHHHLFILARGIKAVEKVRGKPFSTDERIEAFDAWYQRSKLFLRPELTRDDYMIEFFNTFRSTKYALGGEAILNAWVAAKRNPPPPEANVFASVEKRLVVALCRQLQIQGGKQTFFLSCRTLARLLGHPSHSTAATWLGALVAMGFLDEVRKGDQSTGKATEYKYLKS